MSRNNMFNFTPMKKRESLTMDQLVANAKKVLKGRLQPNTTTAFETAIKKAVRIKQRGSK